MACVLLGTCVRFWLGGCTSWDGGVSLTVEFSVAVAVNVTCASFFRLGCRVAVEGRPNRLEDQDE